MGEAEAARKTTLIRNVYLAAFLAVHDIEVKPIQVNDWVWFEVLKDEKTGQLMRDWNIGAFVPARKFAEAIIALRNQIIGIRRRA
jgi:hypothetical protein